MPTPIPWAAKFGPDPKHPGYSAVVGSYAADFLEWAKLFGSPTWHPRGDQCVLGRVIEVRAPHYELVDEIPLKGNQQIPPDAEFEVIDPGCRFRLYWPLTVLEPIYESMLKRNPVGIIDPRTGEPILRSAI